ncbi:MAG TPA: hypothetical protein PLR90_08100 [Methylophilus sp.]|nr:hypothetical protein [Methylophilus sp.]
MKVAQDYAATVITAVVTSIVFTTFATSALEDISKFNELKLFPKNHSERLKSLEGKKIRPEQAPAVHYETQPTVSQLCEQFSC